MTRCQAAGFVPPIACITPMLLNSNSLLFKLVAIFVAMMADGISKIGFIGLGLMGLPMVQNLIKKTPETTKFFVYDVVEDTLKKFCDEHSTRATAMKSSREVAEAAVCTDSSFADNVRNNF